MSRVAIITLNYNQNQFTLDCVNSILKSSFTDFTIILVDNGSTEENYSLLRQIIPNDLRVEFLRIEQNCGYVGGVNTGLKSALKNNSTYILVMNNDTILAEDALEVLVRTQERFQNKVIVTGKVYHYDNPAILQDVGYMFTDQRYLRCEMIGLDEVDSGQYDVECVRDMIDDIFWLFPLELIREIGGYSEFFWFNNEQADFAIRAKKSGYQLVYAPKAKIWHKGSVSIGGREDNPVLTYWAIQSSLIYRYIHLKRIFFFKFFISFLLSTLLSFIKSFITDDAKKKKVLVIAKIKALHYFLIWVFRKNANTGMNPFLKDRR